MSSLVQLMRSRCRTTSYGKIIHSDELEEDIMSSFIIGKPRIGDPLQLRKVFQFKMEKHEPKRYIANMLLQASTNLRFCCFSLTLNISVEMFSDRLKDAAFKIPLPDNYKKSIEHEYQSATLQLLDEMITALAIVLGNLVKELDKLNGSIESIREKSALDFIISVFSDSQKKDIEILREIQLRTISESQLNCLRELPVTATYSCLKHFIDWVEIGFYDFCMIPSQFRAHMAPKDKKMLDELNVDKLKENFLDIEKFKQELIDLTDALELCESDITSNTKERINVSLCDSV